MVRVVAGSSPVAHPSADTRRRAGAEVEEALDDLRSIATGVYPQILADAGVAAALRSASRSAAIPVAIENRWRGRQPENVELAVYFACLEALQNAAKHAGPGVRATVRLTEDGGRVRFMVEDNGPGLRPDAAASRYQSR